MIEFRPRTVTDVVCNGAIVDLTPLQRAVLNALLGAKGKYVGRLALERVTRTTAGTIKVVICNLREILADHGLTDAIETKRGEGWRWAL